MIIVADVNLPGLGQAFADGFQIETYEGLDDLITKIKNADILLCRSTLTVNEQLLEDTPIQLVATATSGTNHIDKSYLAKKNIPLIAAQGANACAVADWVLSVFAHIQAKLSGKQLGIIGMGHVGSELNVRLRMLNYDVRCCDPLIDKPSHFTHVSVDKLVDCDALFIHANLHDKPPYPSDNLINHAFLKKLKSGCFIVNASRGGIVDEGALLDTLFIKHYCTDVYENEPYINAHIVKNALICTPHIAGHTIEAKINAVFQISDAIHRLYNKPIPPLEHKSSAVRIDLTNSTWSKQILAHYNPLSETIVLKEAKGNADRFISLRKGHIRHALNIVSSQ